jgi:chloramphenicol 3-O phosphotransferase
MAEDPLGAAAAGAAPGTIILLNGTSCSGKTSLVRALQQLLPEPYLHVGLDHFEAMQPRKDGQRIHMFYGQGIRAHDLVHVLHVASAAFAAAGANQVVEHIFLERAWLKDAVARLAPYPVLFVGVRCPVEELERRERARYEAQGQPWDPQAASQAEQLAGLHAHAPYDLVVDTITGSPEALAGRIRHRLETGPPPAAFRGLAGSPILDEPGAAV